MPTGTGSHQPLPTGRLTQHTNERRTSGSGDVDAMKMSTTAEITNCSIVIRPMRNHRFVVMIWLLLQCVAASRTVHGFNRRRSCVRHADRHKDHSLSDGSKRRTYSVSYAETISRTSRCRTISCPVSWIIATPSTCASRFIPSDKPL